MSVHENKENIIADVAMSGKSVETEVKSEIEKYLAEGKRAMIGHDYQTALEPLAKCCHLIATNFGELDSMLADPSFQYGLCLFEVSRAQQGVFGTEIEEKVQVPSTSDDKLDPILESEPEKPENGEDRDEEDEEEEGYGDEDDAQLAYEWLEISRVLYSKQEGKEAKLREAETLSLLGELKMEDEKLDAAREDYLAAVALQQKFLDPNDRLIATNYYQAGTVELFLQMPSEAHTSFSNAAKIIEHNLEDTKKKFATETDGSKIGKLKKLLDDFTSILPDIKEKVVEAETLVNEMKQMKETLKATLGAAFGLAAPSSSSLPGSSSSSSSGPSTSVNTLQVKRKSKNENGDAKKSKN